MDKMDVKLSENRRYWAQKMSAPGFHEDTARQGRLLRGATEELEALDFIDVVIADRGNDPGWTALE